MQTLPDHPEDPSIIATISPRAPRARTCASVAENGATSQYTCKLRNVRAISPANASS